MRWVVDQLDSQLINHDVIFESTLKVMLFLKDLVYPIGKDKCEEIKLKIQEEIFKETHKILGNFGEDLVSDHILDVIELTKDRMKSENE
jgi:hypothetical protein